MATLPLAQLTFEQLSSFARIEGRAITPDLWISLEERPLDDDDRRQLAWIVRHLRGFHSAVVNESTLWARAVYPLLMLAERDDVRAWSQVPLRAQITLGGVATELAGVVDGVLAREHAYGAEPAHPFLLVVEAKRGVDANDPRPQLLGAMLASLLARGAGPEAEQHGVYIVGDSWTFGGVTLRPIEEPPGKALSIRGSREYTERTEAEAILRVVRGIVDLAMARGAAA